jgi:hypothetical protein
LQTEEITTVRQEKIGCNGKTFVYMQNILLPQISLHEVFYYRQGLIHEFCIRDMKNNKAFFYLYREGEALREPNKVCTFLLDFTGEYVPPTKITELFLVSAFARSKIRNARLHVFC